MLKRKKRKKVEIISTAIRMKVFFSHMTYLFKCACSQTLPFCSVPVSEKFSVSEKPLKVNAKAFMSY